MRDKGVTLIALIVTIIIMLILAGVAIATLGGQDGIIRRAREAAEKTNAAQENELAVLNELENWIDNQGENGGLVANAPDTAGFSAAATYYVTWDTSVSPYQINDTVNTNNSAPENWYNYEEKKWANIKTTGGGNNCYWVWIPRYAYKVPTKPTASSPAAETIEIKFLKDKTNIPIGESGEITNTTPTPGTWVVHPAFDFGGSALSGIWVAKFEASSSIVSEATVTADLATTGGGDTASYQVRVIPNVTSWRGISVNNIFTVCRNMTSLTGATGIDSHMVKNVEWGAAAYLSMSVYGKNERVWNNSYYNNTTNYSPVTGLAGPDTTEKTDRAVMNAYNTTGGIKASTTGNVYGIYDMAGGAHEYVAGYLSNYSLTGFTTLVNADAKYKDTYAGTSGNRTENYNLNSRKIWRCSL